ncbi:hypothetical protein Voc01_023990 [Virgisporangium ochraceum]|uniref:Uncharacterized protein n=2 Tax=Virgisporangium ochraceum TaxID=65505 RepID=A0A8J4ED18_9ACTN|nr:hypothetical protein Voc01_023990 [Virgisporangium ochraceum]
MDGMRTRAEEPERLQAAQLAAAAAMPGGVSNQALASAVAAGPGSAALVELATAANGSQAVEGLLHPGVSAPGLGTVGKHGSKPSSLRKGPAIHHLESEHIIPFAVGKQLWDVLSLVVPVRGGAEDRKQTTIMIYKGAAELKTEVDVELIDEFKEQMADSDIVREMAGARVVHDGGGTGDRSDVTRLLADVVSALERVRANAVERTVQAVADENRSVEEGYELSNGERRAVPPDREPDLPVEAEIAQASEAQFDDLMELSEKAVRASG